MSAEHEQLQRDLGVYVLGALGPAERDRLERHLADCGACRKELASLAVLPSMLARAGGPEDWADDVPPLGPVVERLARERRRTRLRTRLLTLAAGLAVLAVIALVTVPRLGEPAGGVEFAADIDGVTASVDARAWGMAVVINATDLPQRDGYVAMAVSHSGHRTQVASWTGTGRPALVSGSCYLEPAEVERMEILAAPEEELLAVLRPAG